MSETTRSPEFQPASSPEIAELYYLIHCVVQERPSTEVGASIGNSALAIDETGHYSGFVSCATIDPFAENNEQGICAELNVGDVPSPVKISTPDDIYGLSHVMSSYTIFHQNARLAIRKHTGLGSPAKSSRGDIIGLEQGDESFLGLDLVSSGELLEKMLLLKKANGLMPQTPRPANLQESKKATGSLARRFIRWIGFTTIS